MKLIRITHYIPGPHDTGHIVKVITLKIAPVSCGPETSKNASQSIYLTIVGLPVTLTLDL